MRERWSQLKLLLLCSTTNSSAAFWRRRSPRRPPPFTGEGQSSVCTWTVFLLIPVGIKTYILCSNALHRRCGPLIDLCRGPHVRHTGKIKALKIHKVRISASSGSKLVVLISVALILHMSHILAVTPAEFPHALFSGDFTGTEVKWELTHFSPRIHLHTGRVKQTWKLSRGSMASPSLTPKCWRSGRNFRRRPRTETTAN